MFCRKFCFLKYLHKNLVIKILDAINALIGTQFTWNQAARSLNIEKIAKTIESQS